MEDGSGIKIKQPYELQSPTFNVNTTHSKVKTIDRLS